MFSMFGKVAIGSLLGAITLAASAVPAEARRYHRGDGGDDAAIAIGAGLVGLAIGAAIASDNDHRHRYRGDYYYDYPRYRGGYYYRDYPRYRGDYRHYRKWRGDRRDYRRDYRRDHRRDYRRDYRRY
ncbi:MAG: hypothetical protein AB7U34_04790 [Novosphingobium sp.]